MEKMVNLDDVLGIVDEAIERKMAVGKAFKEWGRKETENQYRFEYLALVGLRYEFESQLA